MARNEAGPPAKVDSEFLHDSRIAIRRTRSALSLVDKHVLPQQVVARAKRDFREIAKPTNRMRDLGVYLIAFPAYKAAAAGLAPVEAQMATGMVADSILRRQATARAASPPSTARRFVSGSRSCSSRDPCARNRVKRASSRY